jgi:hypothetical protein
MLLAIMSLDWADEFTVKGFRFFTEIGWQKFKNEVEDSFNSKYYQELCYGSNEYVTVDGAGEYLNAIVVEEVSDEDYKMMVRVLDLKKWDWKSGVLEQYGMFLVPEGVDD